MFTGTRAGYILHLELRSGVLDDKDYKGALRTSKSANPGCLTGMFHRVRPEQSRSNLHDPPCPVSVKPSGKTAAVPTTQWRPKVPSSLIISLERNSPVIGNDQINVYRFETF
jgi:hypothetical protein